MAQPQPKIGQASNSDWVSSTYFFAGASLDKSVPASMCSGPFELSGVDLREFGALIRLSGFVPLTIGAVPVPGDPAPKYIARLDLNKGSSGHELKGFVILRRHVIFSYWDTELRAMFAKVLRYDFGGLQLSSDSFRATSSNVALYLSYCGQTTGSGSAAAGQRRIHCDSPDFFRAGDTIAIERDTGKFEEAIVDATSPSGTGADLTTRSDLLFTHGPKFDMEGGSGKVGMTVVTHDGTNFLVEQAGPLQEDGEATLTALMEGGVGITTTTTTLDVSSDAPKVNPIHSGDTLIGGTISKNDLGGSTGVELELWWLIPPSTVWAGPFRRPDQGPQFTAEADRTWRRPTNSLPEGRKVRARARVQDVGDGSPGPWGPWSNEVTVLHALPATKSNLATIDNTLYEGSFRMTGTLPAAAMATADAQVVLKNADGSWTAVGAPVVVGTGTFSVNIPNNGEPFRQGKTYSLRSRDYADAGWSGDLDGKDGRLLSISVGCAAGWSTMATINTPVHVGDLTISGVLQGNYGAAAQGQVVKWSEASDKWLTITTIQNLGQHGPNAWEISMRLAGIAAPIVVTGDLISVRTRPSSTGVWSGSLLDGRDSGDDGRLRWSATKVVA